MTGMIAHAVISVPPASVVVEEDPDTRELSIAINGRGRNWYGRTFLGKASSLEPGPEHTWIRTRTCEALFTAMGPRGLDSYTQMLIHTTPGWYDVCELINAELGGVRVLE